MDREIYVCECAGWNASYDKCGKIELKKYGFTMFARSGFLRQDIEAELKIYNPDEWIWREIQRTCQDGSIPPFLDLAAKANNIRLSMEQLLSTVKYNYTLDPLQKNIVDTVTSYGFNTFLEEREPGMMFLLERKWNDRSFALIILPEKGQDKARLKSFMYGFKSERAYMKARGETELAEGMKKMENDLERIVT